MTVKEALFFPPIFNFLSFAELGSIARVCKQGRDSVCNYWETINISQRFPSLVIKDKTTWQKHADLKALEISVDDAPDLEKIEYIKAAKSFFDSLKKRGVENNCGVTDLTLPGNLSRAKLKQFAEAPKFGHVTHLIEDKDLEKDFKDTPTSKTKRLFITNGILAGSREQTWEEQDALAEQMECDVVEALALATLAILTYVSSPEGKEPIQLYKYHDPKPADLPYNTYTLCVEESEGKRLMSGSFYSAGFAIRKAKNTRDYVRGVSVQREVVASYSQFRFS